MPTSSSHSPSVGTGSLHARLSGGKSKAVSPPDTLRSQAPRLATQAGQGNDDELRRISHMLKEIRNEQTASKETLNRFMDDVLTRMEKVMEEYDVMKKTLSSFEQRLAALEGSPVPAPVPTATVLAPPDISALIQEEAERLNRKQYAIVRGIPDMDGEKLEEICSRALRVDQTALSSTERLGTARTTGTQSRPIRIKFQKNAIKGEIYRRRFDLKLDDGSPVYFSNDLTRKQLQKRKTVLPQYKHLRSKDVKCQLPYDVILDEKGVPLALDNLPAPASSSQP
eukprot:scpid46491/ scgid6736/ 